MKYAELLKTLDRIEAERGCKLPELCDPTLLKRARRLLACDDPPCGLDVEFVRHIIGGGVENEEHWIA
jgi:hypothetical protein